MTRKSISEAVNNINDRHVEEAANFIIKRQEFKMKKISNRKIIAFAACLCICVLAVLISFASSIFEKRPAPISPDQTSTVTTTSPYVSTSETQHTIDSNIPSSSETNNTTTTITVMPSTQQYGDTAQSGGTVEMSCAQTKATVNGTGFTQQEIDSYINENKNYILSVVQFEPGYSGSCVSIYKKGIYYVSLGEKNEVNLNCLTLPVLVDGKIYANVVLIKADGDIVQTISIGGTTWDVRNDVLFDNPDKEIVFAYLPGGIGEIMIYPDNTAVNPVIGEKQNVSDILKSEADWYNLLKTQYNTVSGNELTKSENLVVINK